MMFIKILKNILTQDKTILFYLTGAILFFILDAGSILLLLALMEYLTSGNIGSIPFLGISTFNLELINVKNFIVFVFCMQLLLLIGSMMTSRYLALKSLEYGFNLGNQYIRSILRLSGSEVKKQSLDILIDISQRESERIGHSVVLPLLICTSRLVFLVLVLSIVLMYFDNSIILSLLAFVLMFSFLSLLLSPLLNSLSVQLNIFSAQRLSATEDIFTGFSIIKGRDLEHKFLDRSNLAGIFYSKAYSKIELLINSPRYLIDFIIVSMICYMAYGVAVANSFSPITSDFGALAVFIIKFVPSANIVYQNYAKFKANVGALSKMLRQLEELPNGRISNLNENKSEKLKKEIWTTNSLQQTFFRVESLAPSSYNLKDLFKNPISFCFSSNTLYIITGPNGSGKSSLLNMMAGVEGTKDASFTFGSNSWEIDICENDLRTLCWKMDQETPIFKASLLNNCTLFGGLEAVNGKGTSTRIAFQLINGFPDQIKLSDDITKIALSGGQRQKIGLVRALLCDNPVVLLDEPTNSMDAETKDLFLNVIHELKAIKIVICISHSADLVSKCDQLLEIEDGMLSVKSNIG